MAHVAFFSIADAGHVNPTLDVVAELVRRGHQVSYVVSSEFHARVRDAGARPVDYTAKIAALFAENPRAVADADWFSGVDLGKIQRGRLDEAVTNIPPVARAFGAERPDLVVYSPACWTGALLAARWRVPAVRSIPTFAANEHWSLGQDMARQAPASAELNAVYSGVGKLVARLGVDLDPAEFFTDGGGRPGVVYLPRSFQYAGETFDDSVRFVGPCATGLHSGYGDWQPPADGKPVLLATLGTAYNGSPRFFQTCAEAFAESRWHVVFALGGGTTEAQLGPMPANVEVRSFVPQTHVLRHADAFVCHGGMGSVMEALTAEVPMVVVPQMPEQRANAERLAKLGLGGWLHRDELSADGLREAVETATTDPRIRHRLKWMRGEIEAAGGAPAAADHIEARIG